MSAQDQHDTAGESPKQEETAPQQISLPPQFFARHGVDPSEYAEKPKPPKPRARTRVPPLLLKGVDMNRATREQLVSEFRYIGAQLAYQIVREREQHGPYLDVYDLERVPGLGPKTFQKLTDLPWREGASVDAGDVIKTLGFPPGEKIKTAAVAQRFSEMPGFDGCVIVHEDGYVLAAHWNHLSRDALGVFAPQFSKKLQPYVEKLQIGELDSLTMCISERPITLVQYKDIVLAAVHKPNRFSRRQVRLAQQVVRKLRHVMLGEYAARIYNQM